MKVMTLKCISHTCLLGSRDRLWIYRYPVFSLDVSETSLNISFHYHTLIVKKLIGALNSVAVMHSLITFVELNTR